MSVKPSTSSSVLLSEARKAAENDQIVEAEVKYRNIIQQGSEEAPSNLQDQESSLLELGKIYETHKQAEKLNELLLFSRKVLGNFAKLKTAKIVKVLIECFDTIEGSKELQIRITKDSIQWSIDQNLSFLRQSLQFKLASLLFEIELYQDSLGILNNLLREYKKLDDKFSLIGVQLLESRVYHSLRNIPKARSSLTSARTSANSVYCPTILQAELDCQSGIINSEENDYKTAFSYFYESFEGFNTQDDPRAALVLKYMLLSKIMVNLVDDIHTLLNNKNIIKYQSREIDAMKAIAIAYSNRSLHEFETALSTYSDELRSDPIIKSNFNALYDNLLEQNLLKIIQTYSCVELSHISKTIGLDIQQVEGKLSQMILDKVFYGVLDQGNGWLIIYDEPSKDATYESSINLIKNLSNLVDLLYDKASALN